MLLPLALAISFSLTVVMMHLAPSAPSIFYVCVGFLGGVGGFTISDHIVSRQGVN